MYIFSNCMSTDMPNGRSDETKPASCPPLLPLSPRGMHQQKRMNCILILWPTNDGQWNKCRLYSGSSVGPRELLMFHGGSSVGALSQLLKPQCLRSRRVRRASIAADLRHFDGMSMLCQWPQATKVARMAHFSPTLHLLKNVKKDKVGERPS